MNITSLNILITGGAGYIGSHMIRTCIQAGFTNIIVLDDLSTGYKDSIPRGIKFIQGSIGHNALVSKILVENNIDAVFHFTSSTSVEESMSNPIKYYHNNTANSLSLINNSIKHKVKFFIFSSSASIFGNPLYIPVDEKHPKNPISPYGKSKLMIEEILKDIGSSNKWFKFGCLRYFNVAGCDVKNGLGIRNPNVTNLIPILARNINSTDPIAHVFGNDYNTSDGTCIRDFVHVIDICTAHLNLLEYLANNDSAIFECEFNLGTSNGFSVLQVIKTMEKITNTQFKIEYLDRRQGDIEQIVSDNKKAQSILHWQPKLDLDTMIETSYIWDKMTR